MHVSFPKSFSLYKYLNIPKVMSQSATARYPNVRPVSHQSIRRDFHLHEYSISNIVRIGIPSPYVFTLLLQAYICLQFFFLISNYTSDSTYRETRQSSGHQISRRIPTRARFEPPRVWPRSLRSLRFRTFFYKTCHRAILVHKHRRQRLMKALHNIVYVDHYSAGVLSQFVTEISRPKQS